MTSANSHLCDRSQLAKKWPRPFHCGCSPGPAWGRATSRRYASWTRAVGSSVWSGFSCASRCASYGGLGHFRNSAGADSRWSRPR
jgi:hypothetical protein